MKGKRMGITEILRKICLFSANEIKSSESFYKQPTQLIVELNSLLRHLIVTMQFSIKIKQHLIQLVQNQQNWTFKDKKLSPYVGIQIFQSCLLA
jgi:hypothetical protein